MRRIFQIVVFSGLSLLARGQNFQMKTYTGYPASASAVTKEDLKEPAVIFMDKRVVEYAYDEHNIVNKAYFRHKAIKVNDERALESFNKIQLPVGRPENLLLFKARSVSPSGTVKELGTSDMQKTNENGSDNLILAFEGLEKGSIVEYVYLIKVVPGFFGTEYFQIALPVRNAEVMVVSPSNLQFEGKGYNGFPSFRDSLSNNRRYLRAFTPFIAPMEEEKYSTYEANLQRCEFKLVYNFSKGPGRLFGWNEAGEKVFERVFPKEKSGLKKVKKQIEELGLDKGDEGQKVLAVENFIKTNFSIRAYAESEDVEDMLKNRIASNAGVVKLFSAFYEVMQIPYEVVLTTDRFTRKFDPEFENWNSLEEYLIYFPNLKSYIDPNGLGYRLGLAPFRLAGNHGLFIRPTGEGVDKKPSVRLEKISLAPMDMSFETIDAESSLDLKEASLEINMKRTHQGHVAAGLRPYYHYAPDNKKKEVVETVLKSISDDIQIQDYKVINGDMEKPEGVKDFIIEAKLKSSSLVEKSAGTYLIRLGDIIGKQTEMYQEKPRVEPADVNYLHYYQRDIRFKIPEGFEAKGIESLNINKEFKDAEGQEKMGFISKANIEKGVLTVHVKEYYNSLTVPLAEFENFRTVINAAADFNKGTLVLSPRK